MLLKTFISAFKPILRITVRYISQIWKTYCKHNQPILIPLAYQSIHIHATSTFAMKNPTSSSSHLTATTALPSYHTPNTVSPPPNLPILNKTPSGRTKLIKTSQHLIEETNCPYAPLPSPTHLPTAFCKASGQKYCPNHYTAYRPAPLKITLTQTSCSCKRRRSPQTCTPLRSFWHE